MSGEKAPTRLDDMTFGEAFKFARSDPKDVPMFKEPHIINWRGVAYNIRSVEDVADGFKRQAQIDREALTNEALCIRSAYEHAIGRVAQLERLIDRDLPEESSSAVKISIPEKPDTNSILEHAREYIAHITGIDKAKPDSIIKINKGTDIRSYFSAVRDHQHAVADAYEAANSADRTAPIGRMKSEKPVDVMKVERTLNGGWTVETLSSEPYRAGSPPIGAFTTTADMLRALADLLERDDEKRKEAQDG